MKIIMTPQVVLLMLVASFAASPKAMCDNISGVNDVSPVLSQPLLQEPISDFQIGITQGAENPTLHAVPGKLTVGLTKSRAGPGKKFAKPNALASAVPHAPWLDLAVKKSISDANPTQVTVSVTPEAPVLHSYRIPGGIVDLQNSVVYVDGSEGGIDAIQLATGRVIFKIKHACMPVAVIDDKVIAFGRRENSWRLVTLDVNNAWRQKSASLPLPIPETLDLPLNNSSFLKAVNVHDNTVQVSWQTEPPPFGYFTLKLFNWGHEVKDRGTFGVNLANGQVTDLKGVRNDGSSADVTAPSSDYQFTLAQPGDHNGQQYLYGAGAIVQPRLRVNKLSDPSVVWEHDLPTLFVPASP